MRIFLTGATGSIGSSVLQALVDGGHEVTCPVRTLSKVANANSNPHIHYVQINDALDDFTKFNQLAQGFPCIIHTGFLNGPDHVEMETNVTRGLLEAAKTQSANEKVVFVFTTGCLVLGEYDHVVGDSEVTTANCPEFYKVRLAHEELALSYTSENLAVSVLRPCWVYGGSHVDGWVAASKRHGKILVPEKRGRLTFIHKEDLGTIYRLIAEHAGRGFYAGSEGPGPEVEELIELVKRLTGVETVEKVQNVMAHVHEYTYALFGLSVYCPIDSTRAKTELGFVPKYNFVRDAERVLRLD